MLFFESKCFCSSSGRALCVFRLRKRVCTHVFSNAGSPCRPHHLPTFPLRVQSGSAYTCSDDENMCRFIVIRTAAAAAAAARMQARMGQVRCRRPRHGTQIRQGQGERARRHLRERPRSPLKLAPQPTPPSPRTSHHHHHHHSLVVAAGVGARAGARAGARTRAGAGTTAGLAALVAGRPGARAALALLAALQADLSPRLVIGLAVAA
jgi:hypothetical protein